MAFSKKLIARAAAVAFATTALYSVSVMAQQATATGEVRRVNAEQGKVTIQHGPIVELELIAMTLVYKIAPNLLTGIKPGDTVKFTAKREGGDYIITAISK